MTETTYFTHLFGGWKSAEAYRWTNPDGTEGGIDTETLRERIAADHGENDHAADYLYLIQTVENHPGLARKKVEFAAKAAKAEAAE